VAVQETHLAAVPLERARTTASTFGMHLHHGRAVPAVTGINGRSCGVGFVTARGVAVAPVPPQGVAWRMLHAMGRLHAVRLPPRAGLPQGLLLLSVYAPLSQHGAHVERARFAQAMLEVSATLDMQQPTLLMGDFNGSVAPTRDYSAGRGVVCQLLSQLLGPGAPWIDALLAVSPEEHTWTFTIPVAGKWSSSRCDLVLANRTALRLLQSVVVETAIADGGHSPVVVTLRADVASAAVDWCRPRPRPPPLLMLSSADLWRSPEWAALVGQWSLSPLGRAALAAADDVPLAVLSKAMMDALQHLVHLAGGWRTRAPKRREAYDSAAARAVRRRLKVLWRLGGQLRKPAAAVGAWPRQWMQLLDELAALDVDLDVVAGRATVGELRAAVQHQTDTHTRALQPPDAGHV
jgi:exonuclease III